jgi:hypothetical protein
MEAPAAAFDQFTAEAYPLFLSLRLAAKERP